MDASNTVFAVTFAKMGLFEQRPGENSPSLRARQVSNLNRWLKLSSEGVMTADRSNLFSWFLDGLIQWQILEELAAGRQSKDLRLLIRQQGEERRQNQEVTKLLGCPSHPVVMASKRFVVVVVLKTEL